MGKTRNDEIKEIPISKTMERYQIKNKEFTREMARKIKAYIESLNFKGDIKEERILNLYPYIKLIIYGSVGNRSYSLYLELKKNFCRIGGLKIAFPSAILSLPDYADYVSFDTFEVARKERRKGHGTFLLKAAEEIIRGLGVKGIILFSPTLEVREFYMKRGYKEEEGSWSGNMYQGSYLVKRFIRP